MFVRLYWYDSCRVITLSGATVVLIFLQLAGPVEYYFYTLWMWIMKPKRKNRILLVEDDADTRYAMALLFELEGFEVETAGDGKEAYLTAHRKRPDLIVTDINMPNVSGLDLIKLIKEDDELASVPIIAMSAVERKQLNRARELGAIAVYEKPIQFDQFLGLIAGLVSARHSRGRAQMLLDSQPFNGRSY